MNKRYLSVVAVIICMVFITVAAMTVSATGENGNAASSSVSFAPSGGSTSSNTSSSAASSNTSPASSAVSSSSETQSQESSSSQSSEDEQTSSSTETSSDPSSDTSSSTASSGTSSRRPNLSGGGQGTTGTFIDSSSYASNTGSTGSTSSEAELISSDINDAVEENEEEMDHFTKQVASYGKNFHRPLIFCSVLSLLCIGGLIAINILFRKKYPKHGSSGAAHRRTGNGHGAKRANRK